MKLSVEISYYPLNEDFKPKIKGFIKQLNSYSEIEVITTTMSTRVFGEYKAVMRILADEMEKSFENPHSVFVMKFINADLRP